MRRTFLLSAAALALGTLAAATPEKVDCAAAAPKPLLQAKAYPGHGFTPGPDNTASEKISSGTISLEIQFAGCFDGIEHSFVFEDKSPLAAYDDRDHWLAFAAAQLKALKTSAAGRDDVKDLLSFLERAPKAVARKNADELRLEVCRDDSPPTEDGCDQKTGGGYRFAVRALPLGRIEIFVSRYLALGPLPERK
jgi:hypothetical protein